MPEERAALDPIGLNIGKAELINQADDKAVSLFTNIAYYHLQTLPEYNTVSWVTLLHKQIYKMRPAYFYCLTYCQPI